MYCEFNTVINGNREKIFLKAGLSPKGCVTKIIHFHNYTEIHMLLGGNARFSIGNTEYSFKSGDVFAIPPEIYHYCTECDETVQDIGFQTTAHVDEFCRGKLPEEIAVSVVELFGELCENSSAEKLSALISYALTDLFSDGAVKAVKMTDTAALIYEFISLNYNRDIKISDLASELKYSEKQTERLVYKYTGQTFKKLLTSYRLTVAEFLKKNTTMNANEISGYVGFLSYNGFWKAKKKFEENSDKI